MKMKTQRGASFNLDAVKAEMAKKMAEAASAARLRGVITGGACFSAMPIQAAYQSVV
jgi:hypothetical protein